MKQDSISNSSIYELCERKSNLGKQKHNLCNKLKQVEDKLQTAYLKLFKHIQGKSGYATLLSKKGVNIINSNSNDVLLSRLTAESRVDPQKGRYVRFFFGKTCIMIYYLDESFESQVEAVSQSRNKKNSY